MKRMFTMFTIAFLLVANPAAAKNKEEGCDPSAVWKNHGEYVSCVARLHEGGKTVSEAAKSDIGRKESPSPSPAASASASPAAVSQAVNMELQALIQTLQNILKSLQNLAHI